MSKLSLRPALKNNLEGEKSIEYLSNQNYLNFKSIKIFINNSFINELPFGYNLIDKSGNIVGFLGTMFSYRGVGSSKKLYCNLHTWIVDEKFRLNFFSNSKEILKIIFDHNCGFFAKPSKSLIRIFLRNFDMSVVSMKYRINFLLHFKYLFKNTYKIITEEDPMFQTHLNDENKKIHLDHKNMKCKKFLIIKNDNINDNIFVAVLKKRKKFLLNVLEIVYCSNIENLKSIWPEVSFKIAKKFKAIFCGQYYLNKDNCVFPNLKLIKDSEYEVVVKNLPPDFKFDTLYSELVY